MPRTVLGPLKRALLTTPIGAPLPPRPRPPAVSSTTVTVHLGTDTHETIKALIEYPDLSPSGNHDHEAESYRRFRDF